MAYVAGDTILDDEYNEFVNSSSSPYGYNHFAGPGAGEYGLNQSTISTVSAGNNDSHPMIALKGRVLVKIQGSGKAGDRIVSAGNGEARVANLDECNHFNVLGRLIKTKYKEETALAECVIGVK